VVVVLVGDVGVVVVVVVLVLVLVGVVGVVAVCVCVVVVVAVVVVSVCVVCGLGTFAHCRRASWEIVETPCVRLFRSVELTEEGRLITSLASLPVAPETSTQFLLTSAEDTEFSWLVSVDA
jgi:hypothetical protein